MSIPNLPARSSWESIADGLVGELSVREAEILRLLGEGKGLTEIASTLGIAYKTVANTLSRIKEKLAIERTGDLIRFVVENKHLNLMPVGSQADRQD